MRVVATLIAASLIVFVVMNTLPGDPASAMLGLNATPEMLAALHHRLGLDQPLLLRYLRWMGGLATLDLGQSISYGVPVRTLIAERLQVTLPLAALAAFFSVAIGIPIGAAAAARRGRLSDTALMGAAQISKSIPDFWLGVLFILVFALRLGWFPASGFPGWEHGLWPGLDALLLPSLALALPNAAILARLTRSTTIAILSLEFVRVARGKGLTARQALWRHAVPNALVPVVSAFGLQIPLLLTGTVLVENVFGLPGLGRLVIQAIDGRDLTVVQDIVVLLAMVVVLTNAGAAALSARLDPGTRDRPV